MKALLMVGALFAIQFVQGQDIRDHWIFGDSIHIQFTDTGVIYLPAVPMYSSESSSSISDTLGNLLFYGNHDGVFNSGHEILEGSDSLFDEFTTSTSTQGFMIIPIDSSKYICFYSMPQGSPTASLAAFKVDMSLFGGLGGIFPKSERILLVDSLFGEQLQAIRHANGRDWWVIVRLLKEVGSSFTNRFGVFYVSKELVRLEHEIEIGEEVYFVGELAASSSGRKLGLVTTKNGVVQLFDFDRCNGTITNHQLILEDESSVLYGCAFSPNDTFFYYSYMNSEKIFQLNVNTLEIIQLSGSLSNPSVGVGHMELGPDGKIYIVYFAQSIFGCEPYCKFLGAINDPDEAGVLASFTPFSYGPFSHPNRGRGLPNHPNYYLGPLVGSPCDTLADPDTSTAVQPIQTGLVEQCFDLKVDASRHNVYVEPVRHIQNATLEVYNSSGFLQKVNSIQNTTVTWNTEEWPAGLYIVAIRTTEGTCASQKFVLSP